MPDKARGGFQIEVTCPGCGATLELGQDFLTVTCASCSSVLRITLPNVPPAYVVRAKILDSNVRFHVDRHLKLNQKHLTDSLSVVRRFYYPYWKIDGILLRLRHRKDTRVYFNEATDTEATTEQIKVETTLSPYDITIASGSPSKAIPWNLGERVDFVKTVPFAEQLLQERFHCQPVKSSWQDAITNATKAVQQINCIDGGEFGANITQLLRPLLSLIYFPYVHVKMISDDGGGHLLVDGLTGRVVYECEDDLISGSLGESEDDATEHMSVGIEMHKCRNCGEQLPDDKSYAYVCRNCQHVQMLEENPAISNTISVVAGKGIAEETFFPFWMLTFPPGQLQESGYRSRGENADTLVVPAFRIGNFEAMYRLVKRITGSVTRFSMEGSCDAGQQFRAATLSSAEAIALAQVVLTRNLVEQGTPLQRHCPEINCEKILLFYAPFRAENYFYIDSYLDAVTFERTLVNSPVPTSRQAEHASSRK